MKTVLVLDANQRSALAVTRSLGNKSVTVFTADESNTALAGCSRHSKQYLTYPSPGLLPEHFVDALVNLIKEYHIDILLPMTELTSTLVIKHRSAFPEVALPMPDLETIDSLADKCSLMRTAETLNIPVPGTRYCIPAEDTQFNPERLDYPVVLKPGKSWLCQEGHWYRAGVRTAYSSSELMDIINNTTEFQKHPYMIQEYVAGQGQGIFALYDHGKPLVFFAHNRLREKPPGGGVSVLSESASLDPILLSHARTLLDKAHWHGIAMVEFKVAVDGTPYLMEINTRFWGSLQLAVDAGVDFPWLLYQLASNNQPDQVDNYKIGVRLRWLLGDLDSLYLTLRDKQYSKTTKLNTILQFLTPSPFKTRHEVNRWSDPAPAWYEIKQYLRDILN
jgi:predicted ATP-grasp superfamily ATP-dependent carboligase